MPITPTYPGVYIEEIPSGVRTIVGVATSITAFIGRAERGPVNDPVTIFNYGDFERRFGGLHADYPMSYAVRDFFQNGGGQAIIVRLVHPNFATDAARKEVADALKSVLDAVNAAADLPTAKADAEKAAKAIEDDNNCSDAEKSAARSLANKVAAIDAATKIEDARKQVQAAAAKAVPGKALLRLKAGNSELVIEAVSEGAWGNSLTAHVDADGIDDAVAGRFASYGLAKADLFNLTLRDTGTGATEQFRNLTVKPKTPRSVDSVLRDGSNLARVHTLSAAAPDKTDDQVKAEREKIISDTSASPETQKAAKKQLAALSRPFVPGDAFRYSSVAVADQAADGGKIDANDLTEGNGLRDNKRGIYALDKADLFNLLCIPPDSRDGDTDEKAYSTAMAYCARRRAMLIVDSPASWSTNKETAAENARTKLGALKLTGTDARNAALFFPRVRQRDPLREGQIDTFAPCGIIAGVMARTDRDRGVWKAPAGIDAAVSGIAELEVSLTDDENGSLNQLGINCLRTFPIIGSVVWGARTLRGADQLADEYKYIPVRRTALFIEESLYRGLKWVVFEPNDEPLWAQIRLNVGAFMRDLFRKGAFQGTTPREAYFVKCDRETTTQNDINLGIVNIVVGFAPLKPAEFVIVKIQQIAGQIEV